MFSMIDWRIGLTTLALMLGILCPAEDAASQESAAVASDASLEQPVPTVAAPLPSTSFARLIAPSYYISPFASLLSDYSGTTNGASATAPANDLSRFFQSRGRRGLTRVPEMFGDFRAPGPGLALTTTGGVDASVTGTAPVAGGTAGLRIAENNHALPNDRLWFSYNHFHNAFDVTSDAGTVEAQSVNRFMIGAEFLLDEGRTSVEIRLPFASAINSTGLGDAGNPLSAYSLGSDSIGNLSVILKRLLFGNENRAFSVGLGIETPTGSDSAGNLAALQYRLETQAVQLIPYLTFTWREGDWFGHLVSQVDVSVSGDELFAGSDGNLASLGRVDRGVTMGFDAGLGYWLVEPLCPCSSGLAAVSELHYTTTLGDPDILTATGIPAGAGTAGTVGVNTGDVIGDLLNLTVGLDWTRPNGFSIRSGLSVPVRDQRVYDTEVILQINRTF